MGIKPLAGAFWDSIIGFGYQSNSALFEQGCKHVSGFGLVLMSFNSDRGNAPLGRVFFERTILDECVSINIEEKYKIIFMGDHNQTRKRKKS